MNRLACEKSPYLLQHKDNPVDWFAWGNEAFERALRENKPVFLSIGYSTCHWCHVMAHESFEDFEVAEVLNRGFVSVKVDREERPDIDAVYMTVCQALTGSGGWPVTILMTPDKKPFYAGTYLPKKSRYGVTGLLDILEKTEELWGNDRESLMQTGQKIVDMLEREQETEGGESEKPETALERGIQEFKGHFDHRYGGFGTAPKFPAPHNIMLLLEYGVSEEDDVCLKMGEKTLDFMARGGMFDQIGGGFSRYSTDDEWIVPHFEKMLYDNALLAQVYAQAYVITKKPIYEEVVKRILDYVRRELMSPEGGFYCGQDADSGGSEGSYYVFTKSEIEAVLGKDAETFCKWYGVTDEGNFEGKSIPNLLGHGTIGKTPRWMKELRKKIYAYRRQRMPLHRDDKILTAWNAMMISACAEAGFLFENAAYINMARRAESFLADHLFHASGRLLVRYRDGESAFFGNLDDYAYYCLSLIHLYETMFETRYLKKAAQLAEQMVNLFWDEKRGGFYFYGNDDERLIHRPKETYDGAAPSGNAVALHVLLWLSRLTGKAKWLKFLNDQAGFISFDAGRIPSGHSYSLLAFHRMLHPGAEIVCVASDEVMPDGVPAPHPALRELFSVLRRWKGTRPAVLLKCRKNAKDLSDVAPFTENYPIPESGIQYYLCRDQMCTPPFSDVSEIEKNA